MLKFFCKRKGFALQLDATQYLIIFVLLVGLGTFGWQNVQDYGRRDTAQADCTRIASAVSQYHFNNDKYPSNLDVLLKSTEGGPYLTNLPKDPWNRAYLYKSNSNTFAVYTFANKNGSGTAPDINNPSKINKHGKTIVVLSH
jgi:hypothetical protein